MKLEFKHIKDITNIDLLDNLSKETVAVLIHEDIFWIEVNKHGMYYIPDGWEGKKTNNIIEAIEFLKYIIHKEN